MHILKRIELDHTQTVAHLYVSDGDPSDVGLAAGINSIATVIGGTLAGNQYLKIGAGDTDWVPMVQASTRTLARAVSRTNAQILTMPSAGPLVLVEAQGARKIILPISLAFYTHIFGAYTNIGSTCAMGVSFLPQIANDPAITSVVSSLFGDAPIFGFAVTSGAPTKFSVAQGVAMTTARLSGATDQLMNQPLTLVTYNGDDNGDDAGDFEDGDIRNSLYIETEYHVLTIPA